MSQTVGTLQVRINIPLWSRSVEAERMIFAALLLLFECKVSQHAGMLSDSIIWSETVRFSTRTGSAGLRSVGSSWTRLPSYTFHPCFIQFKTINSLHHACADHGGPITRPDFVLLCLEITRLSVKTRHYKDDIQHPTVMQARLSGSQLTDASLLHFVAIATGESARSWLAADTSVKSPVDIRT